MIYQQSMFQKAVSNKVESISKDLENAKALAGQEPTWSIPDKIANKSKGIRTNFINSYGIGVYKIYHKDLLEDDIPSYIGQGNVSDRKATHLYVFRNKGKAELSEKALMIFNNSKTKSHVACKMHDYDPEIDNWYFSFCTIGNKSVAGEYEDLLIKSQEPEFNSLFMSGVN